MEAGEELCIRQESDVRRCRRASRAAMRASEPCSLQAGGYTQRPHHQIGHDMVGLDIDQRDGNLPPVPRSGRHQSQSPSAISRETMARAFIITSSPEVSICP